ncbi:MAG: hypothetical protein ACYCQK_05700 [Acidiferrobacteraceae bacterium]
MNPNQLLGLGSISGAGLILGIVFSTIGVGYMRYGRKQDRFSTFLAGLGLSIYPWFVSSAWLLVLIGAALMCVPLVI